MKTNSSMEEKGLTQTQAEEKLKEYGPNQIEELLKVSPLRILLNQIKKNFMIYLLAVATFFSFIVGKHATGYAISGVILFVIGAGFFQEYKAEKAIKALKDMIVPISVVIRDGKEIEIESKEIVPGDIILLRTGEKIPADCLILEEKEVRVNEAILTGESREINKKAVKNLKDYKDKNTLFMGTFLTNGRCTAKVIHTGMNTQFGKIAGMISTAEKELPLQIKINNLVKYLALIAISASVLTGSVMILKNLPITYELIIEVLLVVIALSVAAFPEGYPAVLVTALASGAHRMAKKNAIVNRMSIIETLGETTVICSDKTGTITEGVMTVNKIFTEDKIIDVSGAGYEEEGEFTYENKKIDIKKDRILELLFKTAVLCNDAKIKRTGEEEREYKTTGSPTEAALLVMAAKAGIFKDDLNSIRLEEIPFNSERKLMSVLSKENSKKYVYVKGAPEILLKKCSEVYMGNEIIKMDKKERERILKTNKKFTTEGYRTLGLAYKETKSSKKDGFEENLVFLGIVGILDPPREEVKESIKLCKSAGIDVKMITGDHKDTALVIAEKVGLKGKVMEGEEIDKITDDELKEVVKDIAVFARVKPKHKLRIVKALKENNEVVTMTGDGVNDAPALKEAHIGVAMGANGTDVSREAADLTLKDDNFATIVSANVEGRNLFNNIRKVAAYQISINYSQMFLIFIGILLGFPLPLVALQILYINLFSDEVTAIALSFNKPSKDIMKRKPRKGAEILSKESIKMIILAGTIIGIGTLSIFYYTYEIINQPLVIARTAILLTIVFCVIANAFNFRSFRTGVQEMPVRANKYLIYTSIVSFLSVVFIIHSPLNTVFEVAPMSIEYWLYTPLIALISIFVLDFYKIRNRKLKKEV